MRPLKLFYIIRRARRIMHICLASLFVTFVPVYPFTYNLCTSLLPWVHNLPPFPISSIKVVSENSLDDGLHLKPPL